MIGGFQDQRKSLGTACCKIVSNFWWFPGVFPVEQVVEELMRDDPFLRATHEAQHRFRILPVISREYDHPGRGRVVNIIWPSRNPWF